MISNIVENTKKKIYLSGNKNIVKLYLPYYRLKKSKYERIKQEDLYIDHKKKILFIHNPKVAGKSIKKQLGLNYTGANHITPTFLVDKKTWENYFSIVAVRHPIERLVSSFNYHTKKEYVGNYLTKFPNLHSLSFDEYFYLLKKEPWAIRPQVDYLHHFYSDKKVDFIVYFENLQEDMNNLCEDLEIPLSKTPDINKSPRRYDTDELLNSEKLKKDIYDFYRKDFKYLNYSAKNLIY